MAGIGDGTGTPGACREGCPYLLTEFPEKSKMLGLTLTISLIGHNRSADALQGRLVAKTSKGRDLVSEWSSDP